MLHALIYLIGISVIENVTYVNCRLRFLFLFTVDSLLATAQAIKN